MIFRTIGGRLYAKGGDDGPCFILRGDTLFDLTSSTCNDEVVVEVGDRIAYLYFDKYSYSVEFTECTCTGFYSILNEIPEDIKVKLEGLAHQYYIYGIISPGKTIECDSYEDAEEIIKEEHLANAHIRLALKDENYHLLT